MCVHAHMCIHTYMQVEGRKKKKKGGRKEKKTSWNLAGATDRHQRKLKPLTHPYRVPVAVSGHRVA